MKIILTEKQIRRIILNEKKDETATIMYELINATDGAGTDEEKFVSAVKKIKNSTQFWNISSGLKKEKNKNFIELVNSEFGVFDQEDIKKISNHLKSIGIVNDIYDGEIQFSKPEESKDISTCKPISNKLATNLIVDHIEGGYYNPNTGSAKEMKDSGETMFGMDRKHGSDFVNSSGGQEFWKLIDEERKKDPKKWVRYYKLDDNPTLKQKLIDLIAQYFIPKYYPMYSKGANLDPKVQKIIDCDPRLSFHMIYAIWNGPSFFKFYAEELTKKFKQGVKNPDKLFNYSMFLRKTSDFPTIRKSGHEIEKNIAPKLT